MSVGKRDHEESQRQEVPEQVHKGEPGRRGKEPACTALAHSTGAQHWSRVVASMNWVRQAKSRTSWEGLCFFLVSVFIFIRVLSAVHYRWVTSPSVK